MKRYILLPRGGLYIPCCILFLLLAVTYMPSYALERSIIHSFNISDLSISDVRASDGNTYTCLYYPDYMENGDAGAPQVPVAFVDIPVPMKSIDFSVTVDYLGEPRILDINNTILPVQEDYMISEKEDRAFTAPDFARYSDCINNPVAWFCNDTFIESAIHLATVGISPIVYDADKSQLRIYENLSVTLHCRDCGEEDLSVDITDGVMASEWFDEGDSSLSGKSIAKEIGSDEAQPNELVFGRYYIITAKSLVESFETLAAWKRSKGYIVTVKAIEDILNDQRFNPNGLDRVDNAASLRAYLKNEFNTYKTAFFCLLAGDSDTYVPFRYAGSEKVNEADVDREGAYYPTDIYFSDLVSDWNLEIGPFGEYYAGFKTLEYNPSIYVGRLMCHAPEEVERYTRKLMIYEANPGFGDNAYLNKALYFFQYGLSSCAQELLDSFDVFSETPVCFYDNLIENKSNPRGPTGETIIKEMDKCGYSSWIGHGNPGSVGVSGLDKEDSWECITALDKYDKSYTYLLDKPNNGLDNLTNINRPSIVYSFSCCIMPFDKLDGYKKITYNMGSSFTVGGNYGGPALLGNTRDAWYSEGRILQVKFGSAIQKYRKLGVAEAISKSSYRATSVDNKRAVCIHNLMGDPEFEMWFGSPSELGIDLQRSKTGFTISSPELKNSIVNVVGDKIDFRFRTSSSSFSTSTIRRSFDWDSPYVISVWKEGYLPYSCFYAQNATLSEKKTYSIRNAELGSTSPTGVSDYVVGANGELNITALDNISCNYGFKVSASGVCNLDSEQTIEMNGCKIAKNAVLNATGKTIVINPGSVIEAGATVQLMSKKIK